MLPLGVDVAVSAFAPKWLGSISGESRREEEPRMQHKYIWDVSMSGERRFDFDHRGRGNSVVSR